MTTQPGITGVAVPAADIFRSEIQQAKRLGYAVQTNVTGVAVVVRLVPKTQKAKRIAAASAPEGSTAPAIESVVAYPSPSHRIDAMHAALTATLLMAHDAAA